MFPRVRTALERAVLLRSVCDFGIDEVERRIHTCCSLFVIATLLAMPKYRDAPKSEMDSQRALLDSLMGINRNKDKEEDQVTDYRDERVCKFFLVGMCPNG